MAIGRARSSSDEGEWRPGRDPPPRRRRLLSPSPDFEESQSPARRRLNRPALRSPSPRRTPSIEASQTPPRRHRDRPALRSPSPRRTHHSPQGRGEARQNQPRAGGRRHRSPVRRSLSNDGVSGGNAADSGFTPQQMATLQELVGGTINNNVRGRAGGRGATRGANRGGRGGGGGRWAVHGVLFPPNNAPPQYYRLQCMAHRRTECTECIFYIQMF